jgi:hypothetical protein
MQTRIERIRLGDLRLLEVNARYFRRETFATLIVNIARDGCLTSVPLAWREPGQEAPLVLSGNHRVMAAIEALGADHVADVMVTDDPLTPAQRTAIALSHNAIAGEDDPATLKLLYEAIDDVDWRLYSGLDDKMLELLARIAPAPLQATAVEYLTCTLLLLPEERDRLEASLLAAEEQVQSSTSTYLGRLAEYDRVLDSLDLAGRASGIRNSATALAVVLDVFDAHLTDLSAAWEPDVDRTRWIPLATIFGTDEVPPAAARVIQRAIARMVEHDEVSDKARWQSIEFLCADYLAGVKDE